MLRLSWNKFFVIVFCTFFSIFVANVVNLVNIDEHLMKKVSTPLIGRNIWNHPRHPLILDDSPDHLIWFIQISDLHISIFDDKQRISQFKEFTETTIDAIKPSVVLASGDLTDAKDNDKIGSRQYLKEWKIYNKIVDESEVLKKTIWLDIRGNHDTFNVPHPLSDVNYFAKYSVQGSIHRRSYLQQIEKGNDKYSFIAIDACLQPGPKRPFNFFGYLTQNDTNEIIHLAEQSRMMEGNYIIWFGHYPTSCIITTGTGNAGLRAILGSYEEGFVYLCGHLHTLGGAVPSMYTLQPNGFLELELGDWKISRRYRLAAIDHGLFSFVDINHNEWPVVLLTNPKNALFNVPGKENPNIQINSTHIRLLAFSPPGIDNCTIRINKQLWMDCKKSALNLYVVAWNPTEYLSGLNDIEVLVYDKLGRKKHILQQFSLDGSRLSFDFLGRIFLMADAHVVFPTIFTISLVLCIGPLIIFRIWHTLVINGKCKRPNSRRYVRRLWILSTINRLIGPIILYCLYLTFGPWFIGEVIDNSIGVIFIWGIYTNGAFVPCTLTFLYGFVQLIFGQFPLICIYAKSVEDKYFEYLGMVPERKLTNWLSFKKKFPFIIVIGVEMFLAMMVWYTYGAIGFLLTPFRTWSVLLNFYLWYIANNIPHEYLKPASDVWQSY